MEQPYVDPYSPLHLRSTLRLPTSSLQVYMGLFASRQRSLVIDATDVTPVEFYVLLANKPARVSANLDDNLVELFASLRDHPNTSGLIPTNATPSNSTFYRLKNPVSFSQPSLQGGDACLHQAKSDCEEAGNRSRVEPLTTTVGLLAGSFSRNHAYLIIELPDPSLELTDVTKELRENHATLFECLQVKVRCLGEWSPTDVEENLKGGTLTEDITTLPPTFKEVQDALARPRWYQTGNLENNQDFQMARKWYKAHFERVFMPVETETSPLVRCREFAAFYNVLRGFNDDVLRIAGHSVSSSLKASNFAVHFLQPPFFSLLSRNFEYRQDKSWGFPIFVDATNPSNAFRKFIPRSDCMVFSSQFDIPFVICEVISDRWQSDRSRMLVQATVLARVGQILLRSTSEKKFFVVAIYVDANMVASRYIVMQTEGGNSESNHRPVSIHEKSFDLREKDEQIYFLQEMYNLAVQVTELSDELDYAKESDLHDIYKAASDVMSLSNKSHTKTTGNTIMHSITEESAGSGGLQDEDGLGVFDAEGIRNILRQMNYKIEFIPYGHPRLAVIVDMTGDNHGYLKFVEQAREVEILQYLAGIRSPSNHTISGVRFWPVEGNTVISMPVAGGWLTSLKNRNEQLWSVALQFVEAVAFMHEHNVAHMDLKPRNVIIPPEGGRLSIIDFSVSIRVRSPDATYRGVVGTEDYMAPEVREGSYKPMLADLWSCGRTLEELCSGCHPSVDHTTLLQISTDLMDQDPEARPKMSTVLERMAPATKRGDNAASRVFPTVYTPLHRRSLSPLTTRA